MKIAIASMGRFHVLDLARELDSASSVRLPLSLLSQNSREGKQK